MRSATKLKFWTKSICTAFTLSILAIPLAYSQQMSAADPNWAVGGHDIINWRDQPNTSINTTNVVSMKEKWVFSAMGDVSATPAVVNNVIYFPDYAGYFYAVNASNGSQIWSKKVSDWTGVASDYARSDPAVYNGMIILGDQGGANATWDGSKLNGQGARVMAVNVANGSPIWVTQVETFPAAIVTSSPVVYNNIVYVGIAGAEEGAATIDKYPCCTFRGSLVALNAQTGAKLWQTYTVPDNHGAPGGYSGGAIWGATPAVDAARNSVYIGTGNNYSVPATVAACIKANPNNTGCTVSNDYFDSVLAMDLKTGAIKWANRAMANDTWNEACFNNPPGVNNCPLPQGHDYDFGGSGPNLIPNGGPVVVNWSNWPNVFSRSDILGIGEKSGVYYALNPDNGSTVWSTQVGPGASLGGIEWGTATDGALIYVPISNADSVTYALQPSGGSVNGGSWAGLNPATGHITWQTPAPGLCSKAVAGVTRGCAAFGPASVANGVMFAGSMDTNPANPTMFALSAATGKVLWSFAPGRSVGSAPAIVGNTVYWSSGYNAPVVGGTTDNRLFAFSVN